MRTFGTHSILLILWFQFINTAGLDFNSVNDRKPVEEINLVAQKEGVEYAVR